MKCLIKTFFIFVRTIIYCVSIIYLQLGTWMIGPYEKKKTIYRTKQTRPRKKLTKEQMKKDQRAYTERPTNELKRKEAHQQTKGRKLVYTGETNKKTLGGNQQKKEEIS